MKTSRYVPRTKMIRSFTRFGTYGFLSMMLAAQIATADTASETADRAKVDTKKSARSVKRDAKKFGRKITGKSSKWEDTKDEARDGVENLKDEAKHLEKKAE